MKLGAVGLATFLVFSTQASADFLPDNNLHLQDNIEFSGDVTEAVFNEVIDKAEKLFVPIAASHGGKLKIKREWDESTVNASANRVMGSWFVNMFGGLARRPEITRDGFTMVLCHELGHHLAGFPFRIPSSWGANEGQSDYHAALACSRLMWQDEETENARFRDIVHATAKNLCDERNDTEADQNLCYRQMMAGYSTASLVATLLHTEISFDSRDTNEVKRTSSAHPGAQCRLDTFVAGTLCKSKFDYSMIPAKEVDSNKFACLDSSGDPLTVRPRCWFAPGESD